MRPPPFFSSTARSASDEPPLALLPSSLVTRAESSLFNIKLSVRLLLSDRSVVLSCE